MVCVFLVRLKRRTLTNQDVAAIKDSTPPLSHGSTVMFRSLRDKGNNYIQYILKSCVPCTQNHLNIRLISDIIKKMRSQDPEIRGLKLIFFLL